MQTAAPDIAARFALLIAGLCRVVAAHIKDDRTAAAWIVLVWSRISRIGQRVQRLAAQARAGTVPKLGARFTLSRPRKPATRPPLVLAGKPAWLIVAIPQAVGYAYQLRQLLDDPEFSALLTAAPQLARILRPLCRALGVAPLAPGPDLPDPPTPEPAAAVTASPAAPPPPARSRRPARSRFAPEVTGPLLKPA